MADENPNPIDDLRAEIARNKVIAEETFFWFAKAADALSRMNALAFDISDVSAEAFARAKADFDEAPSRCNREDRRLGGK